MNNIKRIFDKKISKTAFTWLITFILVFCNFAPALANTVLPIELQDENNPGTPGFEHEILEDSYATDLQGETAYEDAVNSSETLINKHRLHFFSLEMPQLENRERNVIVYLPSDYQTGENSYPVVYVLDAQSLFIQAGFSPEDRILKESLFQFYMRAFDREVIIVGIEADPIHFWDEYSPWVNQNMYLWMDPYEANLVEGGEGEAFLDFITQTLKPTIDKRYRTLTNAENTSIGGYKMGGLLSVYAGLTRSDIFSNVMAMSPAVWFAESGQEWLSGNHLLIWIDRNGAPEVVTFFLDVDSEDRITDLYERPAILNSQGSKISFPQAYVEGIQALVNGLLRRGKTASRIIGGIDNGTEWTKSVIVETSALLTGGNIFTYLPLIMKPALISPQITSASSATFTKSSASSFTITTSGYPVPTISISGSLPAGITFTDNHNGTAVLAGTPTETGTYTLTITAQNGVAPNATQTFTLNVIASPLITSASSATFTKSSASSFTITTSGYPVPTISISGSLPAGVSFMDNGNGTATIYGTTNTTGTYNLTITAQNGVAPNATQSFTIKVVEGCPGSGSCIITFSISMSPYLNRTRNISVYLPPNYNSGESYPVIYLMDAQHMFGEPIAHPANSEDWRMDEKLDGYYNSNGRGIIAVGIWFDYNHPWTEYTLSANLNMDHWVSGASQLTTPEGAGMINFIRYALKPEINSRFRTLTDRNNTAIGGGSRTALLALNAGLHAPETFSRVMSFSPAVWIAEGGARVALPGLTTWYSDNGLGNWLARYQAPLNVKYFIYIGTNEQSGIPYPYVQKVDVPGVQISIQYAYDSGYVRITGALAADGVPSANLRFIRNEGGTHHASVWRNYIIPSVLPFFGY